MHATTVALGICTGKPTEARLARERARVDGRDATWTCRRGFQAGADLGGGPGGDRAPRSSEWYPDEREQGPVEAVDVCDEIRVCMRRGIQCRCGLGRGFGGAAPPGLKSRLLADANVVNERE